MPTTVADLPGLVADGDVFHRIQFKDIRLDVDTAKLGDIEIEMDQGTLDAFGDCFSVPGTFLARITPELRNRNLNFFLKQAPAEDALVHLDATSKYIRGLYSGEVKVIPKSDVAALIGRVFDRKDPVMRVNTHQGQLSCDVVSNDLRAEPHNRVGDITMGGLRFFSHVAPASGHGGRNPQLGIFMHRLDCTNGMTHEVPAGKISIRGNTVDEVLVEMEQIANELLADVPRRMEQFVSLAHREASAPDQLIRAWGQDYGLAAGIVDRAEDLIPTISPPVTEYDLLNLVNGLQHADPETGNAPRPTQIRRLQAMVGAIAVTQDMRCHACGHTVGH